MLHTQTKDDKVRSLNILQQIFSRSDEPDTTKTIILGLGDSVLNGGVQTPQDSLATTMFSMIKGF